MLETVINNLLERSRYLQLYFEQLNFAFLNLERMNDFSHWVTKALRLFIPDKPAFPVPSIIKITDSFYSLTGTDSVIIDLANSVFCSVPVSTTI